jgi:hypothetical protein
MCVIVVQNVLYVIHKTQIQEYPGYLIDGMRIWQWK